MVLIAHRVCVGTAVAGVSLALSLVPQAAASIVADGSFEAASCPPNWFVYNATGSPWTFVEGSGVTEPPSPFGAPPPPSGVQVAFLQTRPPLQLSAITQSIVLPAATSYTLSYLHAGRNMGLHAGNVLYEVLIETTVISAQSTTSGLPFTPVSIPFTASPGAHTLTFRLHAATPAGDNTAFFDDVAIIAVPTPGAAALALAGAAFGVRRRR